MKGNIKCLICGLAAGAVLTACISAAADREILLFINGGYVDTGSDKPIMLNDRTYVPLRIVSENLGAKVEWDGEKYQVNIESSSLSKVYLEQNPIITNPIDNQDGFLALLNALANCWQDGILAENIYEELNGDVKTALEQMLAYQYEFGKLPQCFCDAFSQFWTEEKAEANAVVTNNLQQSFSVVNENGIWTITAK